MTMVDDDGSDEEEVRWNIKKHFCANRREEKHDRNYKCSVPKDDEKKLIRSE